MLYALLLRGSFLSSGKPREDSWKLTNCDTRGINFNNYRGTREGRKKQGGKWQKGKRGGDCRSFAAKPGITASLVGGRVIMKVKEKYSRTHVTSRATAGSQHFSKHEVKVAKARTR